MALLVGCDWTVLGGLALCCRLCELPFALSWSQGAEPSTSAYTVGFVVDLCPADTHMPSLTMGNVHGGAQGRSLVCFTAVIMQPCSICNRNMCDTHSRPYG